MTCMLVYRLVSFQNDIVFPDQTSWGDLRWYCYTEWYYIYTINAYVYTIYTIVYTYLRFNYVGLWSGWLLNFLLPELVSYQNVEVEMSLRCPGTGSRTCTHWDHVIRLFISCDVNRKINNELTRWIAAFERFIVVDNRHTPHVTLLFLLLIWMSVHRPPLEKSIWSCKTEKMLIKDKTSIILEIKPLFIFNRRGTSWITPIKSMLPLLKTNNTCSFSLITESSVQPWLITVKLRFYEKFNKSKYYWTL